METVANFIHGECVTGSGQRVQAIFNPATGEQIRQVVMSTAQETEQAIAAAQQAFPAWARHAPLKRARVMFRFKALLEENMERLARIISEEHGKVFSDAVGELTRGLEVVEFACGIPHLQKGEHSANVGTGVDSHSLMQPLGVCAGITPFNFPAMVPMWMFPIALATGNTFVLKPSEKDPSLALALAQLLKEAGLPDGVFNVVQGDKESVDVLLTDPRVQAVSFVGSTPIAEYIYQTASAHGKRCLAVGDKTADDLCARLEKQIAALRVGPGLDQSPENEMGPLISSAHRSKVLGYIDSGEAQGATLRVDGRGFSVKGHEQGYFVGPTLFDNVTPEMTIYKEEIFGPVLSVVRVADYASAVDLINRHEYGNGSAIFTRDGGCARRFCEEVQAGMVGVNVPIPVPMAFHSFGGWKRSIFGALNVHGSDGVRFYTRMKTITARWPEMQQETGAAFSMPTLG